MEIWILAVVGAFGVIGLSYWIESLQARINKLETRVSALQR